MRQLEFMPRGCGVSQRKSNDDETFLCMSIRKEKPQAIILVQLRWFAFVCNICDIINMNIVYMKSSQRKERHQKRETQCAKHTKTLLCVWLFLNSEFSSHSAQSASNRTPHNTHTHPTCNRHTNNNPEYESKLDGDPTTNGTPTR